MPIQAFCFSPFAPLAELAAHKQKLFAGMRPHVSIERAQVRELLPFLAGHLIEQRAFHVHNFIVRERENEVLAPRVEQTESERVMIAGTKERIGLKILEGIVHPAHVPLEVETEAARVNRMTNLRPCS